MVAAAQLRRCGFDRSAVCREVAKGRLYPVFRGVYAVGRPDIGPRGLMRAATLACGPNTVVSHRSAAALLGLLDPAPRVVDVIAPGQAGRRIDGINAHQVRRALPAELGSIARIPCTSPSRTLVDLAGVVGQRTLGAAFERAATVRALDLAGIEAAIGGGGRTGAPALRRLLGEWRKAAPVATSQTLRSPLEAKVLPLLGRRDVPMPRANARVETGAGRLEVDFLWAREWLVVEADSRRHHTSDVAFERDRWRDRELTHAGYTVLRVTWRQAEREPDAIAATIERTLARGAR